MPRRSKVEVSGFEAKYYDLLMNILTLGFYPSFLNSVIRDLEIEKGEKILDLGAGTGRNAVLMSKAAGIEGEIVGMEIGAEMIEQFKKKMNKYKNLSLLTQRIEAPFKSSEPVDRVFISFVLHGFEQYQRILILQNAYEALRPGGRFSILDWSESIARDAPFWFGFIFRHFECELALDFVARDWKAILRDYNFVDFKETFYFRGLIRLLTCTREK